jgi:hypothetical protein
MSKAALQKFEMEMLSELEALAADVQKAGRSELLPLDKSYASLDRAEDYVGLVLDHKVKADVARTKARVARYAGATLIHNAGGSWAPGPDAHDVVKVTKLRAAPKAEYLPMLRVMDYESKRYPGVLRDRTERYDLELQKRLIAELGADLAGTLARLRADAKELMGTDPGLLDATSALTKYEGALARANAATTPRELRRRLHRGAAIAVGQLMQDALGRSQWTVEDDPKHIDFGRWQLFGVYLGNTVSRVQPATKPDGLRTTIEKMIANRKKKK